MLFAGQAFETYKDAGGDAIGVDGLIQIIEELGIDEEDPVLLVFAYLCQAESMAQITREEWVRGLGSAGVSSVAGLRTRLPQLRQQLGDEAAFKEIYAFAFAYYKEPLQVATWPCPGVYVYTEAVPAPAEEHSAGDRGVCLGAADEGEVRLPYPQNLKFRNHAHLIFTYNTRIKTARPR